MAKQVVLHIGLMKTGTTFIQGRLGANRDLLADQNILFPGARWAEQIAAVLDLRDAPALSTYRTSRTWESLAADVNEFPGRAIISVEHLATMGAENIRKAVDSFPDAEISVVMTVRDLGRIIPSMWQEGLKNGRHYSWHEYLDLIRRYETKFWSRQGAGKIAERWAEVVGPDKVHVVTVPLPGAPSTLLWDRFSQVAGIAPAPWKEAPRSNESIGAISAQVLTAVNTHTKDMDLREYRLKVKPLGKFVLSARRDLEPPIGFEPPPWVFKRSDKTVRRLRDSGVNIVGDLADLTPQPVPGIDPTTISSEEALQVAAETLAKLMQVGDTNHWLGSNFKDTN